ncbi:DUF4214 domain-containing protein [Antarctobacter heliothermus]|uniref:DUF4214 domain-containing protein n=1 Tax=Antarctobacter heliothermus TaxID=74033 RepID=A0A239B230_9RHOB|nr:DUF4214 domain-containing protein [Antarctobacter heliothermus]SNS02005.1 protein of unknown function [Antarctobacter heliothermus]
MNTSGAKTLQEIAAAFIASSEFQSTYSDTTDTQFVTPMYRNTLERGSDPNGLSSWVDALDNGMPR